MPGTRRAPHGHHSSTIGAGGPVTGFNDRLIDIFAVLRPAVRLEPAAAPEDLSWQDMALCAETDPEAFFPDKGGSTAPAKAVCRACEVRAECLKYALDHDERFGVWAGISERERRRLKSRFGDDVAAAVASVIPPAGKAAA